MHHISEIFNDSNIVEKIQSKLPILFQMAEIESSKAGKIGMEVGNLREKIIIALLIHKYGSDIIDTEIPAIEPEIDVKIDDEPISIKTITGGGGFKAVWTVDQKSAKEFILKYKPKCDILLTQIFWGDEKGGLYLIPIDVQQEVFMEMGREQYFKMPKAGTNPRGVEFSKDAVKKMLEHPQTLKITINWIKKISTFNVYKRWIELWEEDIE